ncbi:MAG: hypothetical protein FWE64_03970 [Alphaproteobacteria bacterium]|nr:hypothetical protein [Alphaproteobacteria bacterium]
MARPAKIIQPIHGATFEQLANAVVNTPPSQIRNSKDAPKKTKKSTSKSLKRRTV